jgi:hypothetical protein
MSVTLNCTPSTRRKTGCTMPSLEVPHAAGPRDSGPIVKRLLSGATLPLPGARSLSRSGSRGAVEWAAAFSQRQPGTARAEPRQQVPLSHGAAIGESSRRTSLPIVGPIPGDQGRDYVPRSARNPSICSMWCLSWSTNIC